MVAYAYEFNPLDQDNDGLLDSWERTYWPATAGHGLLDDFDHDGYVNLFEMALVLDPTIPNPGGLPPVTNEGGYLTMSLTKQPVVSYEVQGGESRSGGARDVELAQSRVFYNTAGFP